LRYAVGSRGLITAPAGTSPTRERYRMGRSARGEVSGICTGRSNLKKTWRGSWTRYERSSHIVHWRQCPYGICTCMWTKLDGLVEQRAHQVVRLGLGRAVGTLIPPAHDPLVAVVAPHAVVERVARGDVHNVRGRDRRAAVGAVRAACIDRFVGGRRRAG